MMRDHMTCLNVFETVYGKMSEKSSEKSRPYIRKKGKREATVKSMVIMNKMQRCYLDVVLKKSLTYKNILFCC